MAWIVETTVDLPFSLLPNFHAPVWHHPAVVDWFLDVVSQTHNVNSRARLDTRCAQYQDTNAHAEEIAPASESLAVTLDFFSHMIAKQANEKMDVTVSLECTNALPLFERAAKLAHELDSIAKATTARETRFTTFLATVIGDVQRLLVGQMCIVPASWKRPTGADAAWAFDHGDEGALLLVVHRRADTLFDVCVCNSNPTAAFFHAVLPAAPPSPGAQLARVRRVRGVPKERLLDSAFWWGVARVCMLFADCTCRYLLLRPAVWAPEKDAARHTELEPPAPAAAIYENLLPYLTSGCYVPNANDPSAPADSTHDATPLASVRACCVCTCVQATSLFCCM
jgi:hypothetical protein